MKRRCKMEIKLNGTRAKIVEYLHDQGEMGKTFMWELVFLWYLKSRNMDCQLTGKGDIITLIVKTKRGN
jgi:hypothetical protein